MSKVFCGADPCPVILNTSCVFYNGQNLLYTGIKTFDPLQEVIKKIDQTFQNAGLGYAFNNGLIQSTPFDPVQLGGSLIQDTTIEGAFKLTFLGDVQAAKHITTGGAANQFVKGDGTLDSTSYQPSGNYLTGISGDGSASGPGIGTFTLSSINSNPGVFGSSVAVPVVTVNAKGLVTNITTTPFFFPSQTLSFVGDVVGSGVTGTTLTLSLQNVNSNIYTSNTFLKFAVNGKGLVTSAAPITSNDIVNVLGYIPATAAEVNAAKLAAQAAAQSAALSAGIATNQATIATTQAGIATTKANEASQSATNALNSANSASGFATAASNSANDAQNSAINSAQSAADALTSEQNALSSEQLALNSANLSTAQAILSSAARDGAEAERILAEDARDDAEDARDISVAAAQSIESSILALGSISGTVDINLALGTLITATLTGATTLTFSGLPPSTRETAFTLRFSGIHAITLPAGTKYPAGEVPVPAGALYEIPCTINNAGELIVYGVINDIKTP
jgi:hypothetical protein